MRIVLIAVGVRMPAWVQASYADYAGRLPREWGLRLTEVAPARHAKKADRKRLLQQEAERLRAAIPAGARTVALDVTGEQWDTPELAARLSDWLNGGRDLALLVGGPEGIDPSLLAAAEQRWSLSKLTFPHPLVRVMLAEQLYRAWSILHNHPYHRG